MKLTKSQLKEMIREELKLTEARDITPDGKWVVYNGDNDKTIKVVANRKAAIRLMNKILNAPQPDYLDVGAKPLKEEKLNEANPEIEIYKKLDKITDQVFLLIGRYHHKVDMGKAVKTWMTGLHARLKKQKVGWK